MLRKDKEGLPMTFGLIKYRASKPYFLFALKWSVLCVLALPVCLRAADR